MNTNHSATTFIMKPKLSVLIGAVGMLLCIYGTLIPSGSLIQKFYFFISGGLLLLSALMERQPFFIILEIIIVVGTFAAFLPISEALKATIPIVLSIIGIIYLAKHGYLREFYLITGCLGLAFLAAGFAISNPIIYFAGGILMSYFSFVSYQRGVSIAIVWGILNLFFAVTASIGVYRLF